MSTTYQLSLDEVHRALDDLDPVALLVAELTGRPDPEHSFLIVDGPEELIAIDNPDRSTRFLIPLDALRAVRGACVAATAARMFVPPGAATVSVLGAGLSAELLLRMVARYVVGVSHVAVCAVDGSVADILTDRVVDELDLSGISVVVTARVDEAAFGANLVGIAGDSVDLEIDQIAKGAVVVNSSGWDLPMNVVDGAAQVYVDSLQLLEDNQHRHFVKEHQSGGRSRRSRRIAGDLGGLLAGTQVARSEPEDIVLVEVLSAGSLSIPLAHQLTQAAYRLGLGHAIHY